MSNTAQAPATAEGPTQHTQNQAPEGLARLSEQQINFLLSGISANRIGRDGKGFSHVEAWDIRRHLIRVFGFGGYDTDLLSMELVTQLEIPPDRPNGKTRYTVVYRVAMTLTVKVDGVELGHWHGAAIGDAPNQPSLADAHDLALKTADSQALKRAAVNMGDQFGLSLYNNGSLEQVVNRSLAHMKPQEPPRALPEDPPVQPEPQPAVEADTAEQSEDQASQPAVSAEPEPVNALREKVNNSWKNVDGMRQNLLEGRKLGVLDVVVPTKNGPVKLGDLMQGRIDQLEAATQERNAA